MIKKVCAGLVFLAMVSLIIVSLSRGNADSAPHGTVFTKNGIAIRGYDPVAYFTENAAKKGFAKYKLEFQRTTWYFSSQENRELFDDDPLKYFPQYGGYCAWAVAAKGQAFSIDPTAWRIVDGKLYLNYSHDIQRKWEADIPGFIAKGDEKWPALKKHLAGIRGS
ncbi:MAG: YHS domain-containing (seleno)protein [Hyphomicrobiaceae bacterium]